MGLMEDLGAWLDQKRRNVASSVQNPGLLYTRMNEDARQFQQDQRANWGDVKSVVPEVKAAGIKELNASGQELGGLLGTISAKQAKQIIKQTKKFGGSTPMPRRERIRCEATRLPSILPADWYRTRSRWKT
jgi:hypothetical protein